MARGLRDTFRYTAILEHRVDMEWEVPGPHETGRWVLERVPGGTRVVYEFEQAGEDCLWIEGAADWCTPMTFDPRTFIQRLSLPDRPRSVEPSG
ncbi:hypothetical protein QFZ29_000074 [Agromyces albus]|nr:hypothetical protein [Agromyces albus]